MTQSLTPGRSSELAPELQRIRALASNLFIVELWAFVPVLALVAWAAGNSVAFVLVASVVAALAGTAQWLRDKTRLATRLTIGSALVADWMFLIYAASGTPDGFMLDAHMVYFVFSAQILAFFCWRTVIVVTIIPAIHHTFFTALYPLLVWPSQDYVWLHFGNHVIFVLLISSVCLWLSWRIEALFTQSHQALIGMSKAREETDRLARLQVETEAQAKAERTRILHDLAESFENRIKEFADRVAAGAHNAQEASRSLASLANTSSGLSASAFDSADRASSHVETVAAAAEQLGASLEEVRRGVQLQVDIATGAAEMARKSDDEVRTLSDMGERIGNVVDLIHSIASQTNLLALNATIEAARAGEAGKGFAVVANEVKNLANQTEKATQDIAAQVSAMQGQTESTVRMIQEIGEKIRGMAEICATVSSAVDQQNEATREISRSAQGAASNTQEVSSAVCGATEAARTTESRTAELVSASEDLVVQAGDLSQIAESFIVEIRAA